MSSSKLPLWYKLSNGAKSNLEHFQPWGFVSYVHTTFHKYVKLDPRANKHTFIRYSDSSKGYIIYGEHPNGRMKEIESRNVTFIEYNFSNSGEQNKHLELFEL